MRRFMLGLFCLSLAVGCSEKSGKVVVHPVRGQIFYDGAPAAGVKVYLYPTSAPAVPEIPANPHGETDAEGRFTLTTFTEGDGAAEGGYQVVLFWPSSKESEDETDRLLGWYSVARSRITIEVKAGGTDIPPMKLPVMKKPPSEDGGGVPGRN